MWNSFAFLIKDHTKILYNITIIIIKTNHTIKEYQSFVFFANLIEIRKFFFK